MINKEIEKMNRSYKAERRINFIQEFTTSYLITYAVLWIILFLLDIIIPKEVYHVAALIIGVHFGTYIYKYFNSNS